MEREAETLAGLERFAQQSFELLCWLHERVIWPLIVAPATLFAAVGTFGDRRSHRSGL
jgi:tRNA (Thr-GGU) A37 N-methylase